MIETQVCGGQGIVPVTYKTVVLKPNNVNGKNILTQNMMSQTDTKYVIKYDYIISDEINTGNAEVLNTNISQCVNPAYTNALAAYNEAHDAWIDADNAYTNDPTDANLAAKNAAYDAYTAAQTTLNNTPQYYYYAARAINLKRNQHITIPEGCVLLNSSLNGLAGFETAQSDAIVYIGSDTPGTYAYTIQYAIQMPARCLIEFDGGSISDGVIECNNTILIFDQDEEVILKNVELLGDYEYSAGGSGGVNKKDNVNGMATITLKKNKSFASQLTQTNTIYRIMYDFDLDGEEVIIPDNCILDFEGGSVNNGVLVGTKTILSGKVNIENKTGVFTDLDGKPYYNGKPTTEIKCIDYAVSCCFDIFKENYFTFYPQSLAIYNNEFILCGYYKDGSVERLMVVMLDSDHNLIGWSKFKLNNAYKEGHAQSCTIKDGTLYVTGVLRTDAVHISLSTLRANCANDNLDTDVTTFDLPMFSGVNVNALDYCSERNLWCFELLVDNGDNPNNPNKWRYVVTDEHYNVIKVWDNFRPLIAERMINDYATQDFVFDGYFCHQIVIGSGGGINYYAALDVFDEKIVRGIAPLYSSEFEGIAYKDNELYILGYEAAYQPIYKIVPQDDDEIYAGAVLDSYDESGNAKTLYIDNSVSKDSFGKSTAPFKYVSTAMYYGMRLSDITLNIAPNNEPYYIGKRQAINQRLQILSNTSGTKVKLVGSITTKNVELGMTDIELTSYPTNSMLNYMLRLINSTATLSNVSFVNRSITTGCIVANRSSDCICSDVSIDGGNVGNIVGLEATSLSKIATTNLITIKDCNYAMNTDSGKGEIHLYPRGFPFTSQSTFSSTKKMCKDTYANVHLYTTNNANTESLFIALGQIKDAIPAKIGVLHIINPAGNNTDGFSFMRGDFQIGTFSLDGVYVDRNILRADNLNITRLISLNGTNISGDPNYELYNTIRAAISMEGGLAGRKYPITLTIDEDNSAKYLNMHYIIGGRTCTFASVQGSYANRPMNLTADDYGYEYWDTTNNRNIYWTGTYWADAEGNDTEVPA